MKKVFFTSIILIAAVAPALSQSSYTPVSINKSEQPGLVLHLPNNTDAAEGTILQKLKETGYTPETKGKLFWKSNKQDGFYVFNGVTLPALNNQKLDLYFKVEEEKNASDQSIIYMLVSKGYNNFISPQSDSVSFHAATGFLNGFVASTTSFQLNTDITDQEKIVKNAEKKLNALQDDEKSLINKIEGLQDDLRNKKAEQIVQEREVENQKTKLNELRSKLVKK